MSDTYRDQIRTALAQTDSDWGEATGDGDAIPDYIDTLTESVAYLRDDELAKTKHALVFQRGTIIDRTRERDEARAERDQFRDSAVIYAAKVAELNAELTGLRERAAEVEKYWRDWPSERRAKVHALSQFLAGAIEDLAVTVESWRAAPGAATPPEKRSVINPTTGELDG